MKKMMFVVLFLMSQFAHAQTGLFFNVESTVAMNKMRAGGTTLAITTTVIGRNYPNAGIFIVTPGASIDSGECTMSSNGYCVFSVSDTTPFTISITSEVADFVDIILCLNGDGPVSCQTFSVEVDGGDQRRV